jgi:hypothetical protein
MTSSSWPQYEDGTIDDALAKERLKEILAAEIELEKGRRADARKPPSTELEEYVTEKLVEQMLATSAASIDRARKGAEFVQTASAGLGVLYTGVLTFMFSAAANPLPLRGVIPTFFFAVAVVAATFYLSFLTDPSTIDEPNIVGTPTQRALIMANFLTRWTRNVTRNRVGALRAAVMSLAVGVALLPIGFISIPAPESGTSQPPPAEVVWPTPPPVTPPEVAVVLYEHQLDRFVAQLDKATATEPLRYVIPGAFAVALHDEIAAILALAGIALVAAAGLAWPSARRRTSARQASGPPPATT